MTLQNICWTLAQLFAEPGWDHSLNPKANAMYNDQKSTFFTQLSKQGASNPSSFENADVLSGLLESTHTTTGSVESKTIGKYSKRRRSNVAVIIVRVFFISSFFFYCLLKNHLFQTKPRIY